MRKLVTLVLLGLLGSFHAGCALTSKASAITPRFFSPEVTRAPDDSSGAGAAAAEPLELRLGFVGSASHLEERIAYRVNASELGYYQDRLWSERPEEYLRRALEVELFERRHVQRILSGVGTTLDAELTAFEELRGSPARVRVSLRLTLHDDRRSLLEKSISIERPLAPDDKAEHAQRVASAVGSALTAAIARACDDVTSQLRTRLTEPSPAPVPTPTPTPAPPPASDRISGP